MQEEKLSFNYEARYFISGAPHAAIQRVVMVFHGYGMLAKFFLKKFKPLFDEQTLFIAPEGLHKFYKEGF
jgi:hypothetical protein